MSISLTSPVSVALRDVNGDGTLDVVAVNIADATVSILHGRGDASFDPVVSLPAGPLPTSLAVADLDGDGLADIAAADLGNNTIPVFRGR